MTTNLAGQRFGRWLVMSPVQKPGKRWWNCKCDCGKLAAVRAASLLSGHSKSCRCWHTEKPLKHGFHAEPEYRCWSGILSRCYKTSNKSYHNYGGRRIRWCEFLRVS